MPWSGGAAGCGMGLPRWSRHLCDRAPGATAHAGSCKGTLRTLLASTQASGSAGRAQPACHRSQANGVGGLCSEPPFPLRTHTLDPAGASRPRAPARPPRPSPPSLDAALPAVPLLRLHSAAVKAEPPVRCCGRASCPGPWDGLAVRGDRVAQRFPLRLAKQGARAWSGSGRRGGGIALQFWCTGKMRTYCMCSPRTSRAQGDSQAPASVPHQNRAWEDADPQQISHPGGQRGPA